MTVFFSAETHANAEGTIQGILDTELSSIGYQQSKALGLHLQYHLFTHIYSSDLKRAAEVCSYLFCFKSKDHYEVICVHM